MSGRLRWAGAAVVIGIVAGAAAFGRASAAQTSATSTDVLPALLAEVHGLRMAMEHSAAIAPRVQLTLARLNIEEQRIAQLAGQLERARQELSNRTTGQQRAAEALDETEKQLLTTTDDKSRRALEEQVRELKRMQKMHGAEIETARARENEAMQALTTEQSRWIELNARLDELERLLAPMR